VNGATAGDCRRAVCDGHGAVSSAADDTDLPIDANACTMDLCSAGVASHPAEPGGTACAQDGGALCDGAGRCVQCLAASDCPGSDTECSTRSCAAGVCGVTFAPHATPLDEQVAGDCRQAICDGAGGTTVAALAADVPSDDGNPCTSETCSGGLPSHPAVVNGTVCTGPNGGAFCNGGQCAQCALATDCPGSDGECQHRTCNAGICGVSYELPATPVAAQTSGDCNERVCDGAGGVATVPLDTDLPPDDANACTDRLCDGGTALAPASAAGAACAQDQGKVCDGAGACVECNVGADCASRVCASHLCQTATCSDGTKNGAETGTDCGGGTCPACAPGQGCLASADCASGLCTTASVCATPTCSDSTRNGNETDVDCGGSCGATCAPGRACLAGADCRFGSCRSAVCGGPVVSAITPADGAGDVTTATLVTIFFATPALPSTVTVQPTSGPCTGSVQLSADGFTTCLGLSVRVPTSSYGTINAAVLQPVIALARATTYRIRTTTGLFSESYGAFDAFETPVGFTTVGGGACDGSIVVSQIYPGGGLTGAAYWRDFIELHNNGTTPVSLAGMSVQYLGATGYWGVTPLSGTLAAGAHLLVQEAGGASGGAPLPAPDVTGSIDLSPVGGRVVLVSTTVPPWNYCPSTGVLDLVGYGGSGTTPTNCHEGVGPVPAPADSGAALARLGAGCADGNGSALDFVSQLAVPRNTASAPAVCGCNGLAMNGTGVTVELDWCNVQSPVGIAVTAGTAAGPVYGRVYEVGITDPAGAPPLNGELGIGPSGTDPRWAAGWTFVPAAWNAQFNTADELQASFTAPPAGSYAYVYRFSPDGVRWTYCDPNGAGSSPGNPFEPNSLPGLTVAP
jgi:hypothetical protein